jgi:regulator of protease activity HflC (stomatin/prohibitin superfamily)
MEGTIFVVAVGVLVVLLAFFQLFRRITIFEYQRGLRYSNGKYVGVLEPGRHWIYTPNTTVTRIDAREQSIALPGQEIVGADGVSIKMSLAARYRIADPDRAVNKVANFTMTLYSELQIALRDVVSGRAIEELLQQRVAIGAELMQRASGPARDLGVELLALDVKDVMLPGPTKRIFSQVVEARQQGLAALEKARGETAALRNLANAARLVDERPSLMQLRLLQQVGSSTGNTVVLGVPPSTLPIPTRPSEKPSGSEPPADDE